MSKRFFVVAAVAAVLAIPLSAQDGQQKTMKVAGFPAVQYEIRGASGGSNIVYLHTTIETPELFAQVLAWTLPSQEAATREHLKKAILSVRPVE